MAATKSPSKMKHSRFLFIHENGDPMIFYMRPCAERSLLKPDIEHGGGEVTAKVVKHSIKLAGDTDYISTDDYFSTRFIKDCVKANKILDLETYRLNISKSFKSQIQNAIEDTVSDISDDESDLSRIYRTKIRDFKGRMAFNNEEDIAMLKYIIDNHRHKDIQGNSLYKEMELQKVTGHTASSMNCRLRKVIMPNLEKYEIDKTWKYKLTGDPKYAGSTAKSSTLSDISTTAENCVGVKAPPSTVTSNTKKSDSELTDDKVSLKNNDWISKDKANLFLKSYSKGDRVKTLRNTNRKCEPSSKKHQEENGDNVTADEDSFDKALLNAANLKKSCEKLSSPHKRNLRSVDKVNTSSNNSSANETQVPNSGGDNNIDHVERCRKSKRLHPENENMDRGKSDAARSPVKKSQKIASTRNREQTESPVKHLEVTSPKKQKSKTKDSSDNKHYQQKISASSGHHKFKRHHKTRENNRMRQPDKINYAYSN
ncbi:hypothetical protein KUTeg_024370 [Tegillarca granosa]|uniref:Telomeric repeat-binding factor 2-interacting protein 1 n=1 Tax=Tegillarca granosa TaxID=220873 RepID=A0ABQ9E175_TEGGR|nr:hypothetical protein KUTeg_024370 [Tegillarca granosa]